MELNQIYQGDTLEVLKSWPSDFIDCVITSPPYWGLRDYGVEGQIGLEPTLDEYLEKMLAVTRELQRVLKPTGVMFWNHGDNYGSKHSDWKHWDRPKYRDGLRQQGKRTTPEKCLVLQNYRLILRMIDEQGWILRNSIVWHKPNAMPSSVKDRFSNSYESVFMLVKSKKYWFDLDAVRKPYTEPLDRWGGEKLKAKGQSSWDKGTGQQTYRDRDMRPNKSGKNPGDVWKIPTHPFPEAHFATFPPRLIEPMIKAGCPQWVCPKCGKARVRISEGKSSSAFNIGARDTKKGRFKEKWGKTQRKRPHYERYEGDKQFAGEGIKTIGWTDCKCGEPFEGGMVLDPFMGSGTTALVARKLGRNYLGIELSGGYIKIAEERLKQQTLGV